MEHCFQCFFYFNKYLSLKNIKCIQRITRIKFDFVNRFSGLYVLEYRKKNCIYIQKKSGALSVPLIFPKKIFCLFPFNGMCGVLSINIWNRWCNVFYKVQRLYNLLECWCIHSNSIQRLSYTLQFIRINQINSWIWRRNWLLWFGEVMHLLIRDFLRLCYRGQYRIYVRESHMKR